MPQSNGSSFQLDMSIVMGTEQQAKAEYMLTIVLYHYFSTGVMHAQQ